MLALSSGCEIVDKVSKTAAVEEAGSRESVRMDKEAEREILVGEWETELSRWKDIFKCVNGERGRHRERAVVKLSG